jgi:hypothetical protein
MVIFFNDIEISDHNDKGNFKYDQTSNRRDFNFPWQKLSYKNCWKKVRMSNVETSFLEQCRKYVLISDGNSSEFFSYISNYRRLVNSEQSNYLKTLQPFEPVDSQVSFTNKTN